MAEMVKIRSGLWQAVWQPKKASTTFVKGQFVDLVSGFVQPSTSSTVKIFGVNQDSAYASSSTTTVLIPVMVPRSSGMVEADATNTLATTSVGNEFDLSDSQTVDQSASTNDTVVCQGYISATRGLFSINKPNFQ